jgi:uncharacterized protein (TIGR02996 family)
MSTVRQALEEALVEAPGDLASHMAYADYLSEQVGPADQARGELIRVQLALEDEKLSAAEREKLRRRESVLLQEHGRAWVGEELAGFLFDDRWDDVPEEARGWQEGWRGRFNYARGWLDGLEISYLSEGLARAVAQAPFVRLLRRLTIHEVHWEGDPFEALGKSRHLHNVRGVGVSGHFGGGADALVKRLPRLEEVYLTASFSDPSPVFRCRTLKRLLKLTAEAFTDADVEGLAANPALANLTHLALHPHAMDEEDRRPYLRLEHLRALVRSRHLPSLTHLTLRLCDAGDAGCNEVVESGVLQRLKELDLGPGCITDAGARILAACPDLRNLQRLDLSRNRLTKAGIQVLKKTGVAVVAHDQQQPGASGAYDDAYLYEGDCE